MVMVFKNRNETGEKKISLSIFLLLGKEYHVNDMMYYRLVSYELAYFCNILHHSDKYYSFFILIQVKYYQGLSVMRDL